MPTTNKKERAWVNPELKLFLKETALKKGKTLLELKPFDLNPSIPCFDYDEVQPKKKKSVFEFKL
jgi:hypothetical protein